MKDKKLVRIMVGALIACVLIGGCGVAAAGYKHEKTQASQIASLQAQVEYLEKKLNQTTDYYDFEADYKADTYNYFAIGNSLTLITSWGRGICSTEPDNDYFNLIVKKLRGGGVKMLLPTHIIFHHGKE